MADKSPALESVPVGDGSLTWALFNWPRVYGVLEVAADRALEALGCRAAAVSILDRGGNTVIEASAGNGRPPGQVGPPDLILGFDLDEGLRGVLVAKDAVVEDASRGAPLLQEFGRSIGNELMWTYFRELRGIERKGANARALDGHRATESARLAAIGDVAAGMAHEVNNPLSGIMGVAQIALGREMADADRDRKDFTTILREAAKAAKVVADFGAFTRARPAKADAVDLGRVLTSVLESLNYEMAEARIEVGASIRPDLPAVIVDADQVRQVMRNLVVNAIQAMPAGGRLMATVGVDGRAVRVAVEDNGPGIPRDLLPRVFDPFFTTRDIGEGPGLGLSFAFGVIHRHGGRIFAESESGKGARLTFELPVASPLDGDTGGPRA